MALTPPLDGPPPSPATNVDAARETGQRQMPQMGIDQLAAPIGMPQSGPDLSGILTLGEKIEQGLISLAQAIPGQSSGFESVKQMFMAEMAKFATTAGKSNGSMPGGTRGQVVTQAGAQFPGGGQGAGRPF